MSVLVGYLYATSVTAWAVDCYIAFKNIHSLYMTTEIPLLDRADLAKDTFFKFVGVLEMFFVFNVRENLIFHAFVLMSSIQAVVADAVVIWRTWAVYQGWIPVIVAPCVLLLAAFGWISVQFYHRLCAHRTCFQFLRSSMLVSVSITDQLRHSLEARQFMRSRKFSCGLSLLGPIFCALH
jgi:hypothetical protein